MAVYKAPLKDIQFVMNEVLDVSSLSKLPGYEDATPDTIQAILEEAAKLCENVLFPLNRSRRRGGLPLRERRSAHAQGLQGSLQPVPRGGWTAMTCDPEYGGQGLPATVGFAVTGDDHRLEPGLRHVSRPQPRRLRGAGAARLGRAEEALPAQAHRRHLVGHHVPDRAAVRHRPRPDAHQGRAAQPTAATTITGTKIFISAGEHDLTENIVHLVLARLPDAPAGTKGISLFIVPKFLPEGRRQRRRAQRRPLRRRSSTRWASRPPRPAS